MTCSLFCHSRSHIVVIYVNVVVKTMQKNDKMSNAMIFGWLIVHRSVDYLTMVCVNVICFCRIYTKIVLFLKMFMIGVTVLLEIDQAKSLHKNDGFP